MRALANNRPRGISRQSVRVWGLLFIILGTAGYGIVQNRLLPQYPDDLITMSVALALQFVLPCGIPVFTYLLVDGYCRTTSAVNYGLRIAGVALLSEIPYNLAMTGKWLELNSRNPMFGMVLALVLLYIYERCPGKGIKNFLLKAATFFLIVVWIDMLRIEDGMAILIMTATLWGLRKKRTWQIFGGCIAMFLCSIFSIFYLMAPVVFLVIHFYNEEPGEDNRLINYLAYPVILLAIGLIGKYAL